MNKFRFIKICSEFYQENDFKPINKIISPDLFFKAIKLSI